MIGLGVKNYDDMLSRFHLVPERIGRTDRQTDRFAISISRVSMLTRDKNWMISVELSSKSDHIASGDVITLRTQVN